MATDKSQANGSSTYRRFSLVAFVVTVALFLFVSDEAGMRGIGVDMIAAAWLHRSAGQIPYGWEGRTPSGHITGWPVVVLTVVLGLAGLAAPLSSLMSSP